MVHLLAYLLLPLEMQMHASCWSYKLSTVLYGFYHTEVGEIWYTGQYLTFIKSTLTEVGVMRSLISCTFCTGDSSRLHSFHFIFFSKSIKVIRFLNSATVQEPSLYIWRPVNSHEVAILPLITLSVFYAYTAKSNTW